jgi:hypothetical protein
MTRRPTTITLALALASCTPNPLQASTTCDAVGNHAARDISIRATYKSDGFELIGLKSEGCVFIMLEVARSANVEFASSTNTVPNDVKDFIRDRLRNELPINESALSLQGEFTGRLGRRGNLSTLRAHKIMISKITVTAH